MSLGRCSRRFVLKRNEDESGVSGTGIVAEGVEFTSGAVVMTWLSTHRAINVYESIKTVEALHGHEGRTEVIWIDEDEYTKPKRKSRKSMKEAIEELEKK